MSDSRPDLAILVHDLSATGVVRNAIRIATMAAGAGLNTEMWVLHHRGAFASRLPAGVAVHALRHGRSLPLRRLETLMAAPRIATMIRDRKPAVLLSAGNHFHLAASLAYRLAGQPAATRFMGRASNATPRLGWPGLSAIANAVDALKYRDMHRVIAVSHELAHDLHHRLAIADERIVVIPNGVDSEGIAKLAADPLDDPWFAAGAPPVVISAGRLSRQKNYALLIDAFARLRAARTARLVILGEGSDKARQGLMSRAEALGVAADVRLHGFEANPMRYFARADVFVLSSLWEGASNALLEAMACGCPVVTTDCPTGVREQMDGGRIGPIVPMNDADALAHAIEARLAAPRDSAMLKQQAARFDQTRMLADYLALFRSPAV